MSKTDAEYYLILKAFFMAQDFFKKEYSYGIGFDVIAQKKNPHMSLDSLYRWCKHTLYTKEPSRILKRAAIRVIVRGIVLKTTYYVCGHG